MSKLQNRLSRRKKAQTPDAIQPAEIPDDQEASLDINDSSELAGCGQDKSDVIEQLKRRMKKIEDRPTRAFGKKRNPNLHIETVNDGSTFHSEPPQGMPVPNNSAAHEDDAIVYVPNALLPGEVLNTSLGEVWCNRQEYPGYFHGNEPVEQYLHTGSALAAFAKDNRISSLGARDALFIDTETTGLSGGAGTLPFLIGVGFFESDVFVVEQYFSREPSEEPAQLEALALRLRKAAYLVSFNGKSFDMPLINTRFIINKMKNPGYALPHFDLLHVSRRIFKRRLNDRSLQNLERVILGFERHGDIPGAEIPDAYRDYLFGHGEDRIAAILEHNLLDIVALAALGGVLDRIYKDPEAVADVADHLGLASEAFLAGEFAIGESHLEVAKNNAEGEDKRLALHMKANYALKQKQYSLALELFLGIVKEYSDDLDAHFRLAKLYEHRAKDYDKALFHAKKIEALEGEAATLRRIARIEKKKEKYDNRKHW